MTEPLDIDELRRELEFIIESDQGVFIAGWAQEFGPRLLDALAALRLAAEPFCKMYDTVYPFAGGKGTAIRSLSDACSAVKFPKGESP